MDINNLIEQLIKETNNIEPAIKKFKNIMIESDALISIERKNGECHVSIQGQRPALLTLLAGLEKELLKKLNCTETTFNKYKNTVDTREG